MKRIKVINQKWIEILGSYLDGYLVVRADSISRISTYKMFNSSGYHYHIVLDCSEEFPTKISYQESEVLDYKQDLDSLESLLGLK